MATSSSQPLVLEYKQRRYDGGNEREMIAQIEALQQQSANALACGAGYLPLNTTAPTAVSLHITLPPLGQPVENAPSKPETTQSKPQRAQISLPMKLYAAFFSPWVELLWGICGLFIATVVSITLFRHAVFKDEGFRHQRQLIHSQSRLVIRNSLRAILTAPWVAYQLLKNR